MRPRPSEQALKIFYDACNDLFREEVFYSAKELARLKKSKKIIFIGGSRNDTL